VSHFTIFHVTVISDGFNIQGLQTRLHVTKLSRQHKQSNSVR
jgi:hypothetical protein